MDEAEIEELVERIGAIRDEAALERIEKAVQIANGAVFLHAVLNDLGEVMGPGEALVAKSHVLLLFSRR